MLVDDEQEEQTAQESSDKTLTNAQLAAGVSVTFCREPTLDGIPTASGYKNFAYTIADISHCQSQAELERPLRELKDRVKELPKLSFSPPPPPSPKVSSSDRDDVCLINDFLMESGCVFSLETFVRCLNPGRMDRRDRIRMSARNNYRCLLEEFEKKWLFHPCEEMFCIERDLFNLTKNPPIALPSWVFETDIVVEDYFNRLYALVNYEESATAKKGTGGGGEEKEEFIIDNQPGLEANLLHRGQSKMCLFCLVYNFTLFPKVSNYLKLIMPWFSEIRINEGAVSRFFKKFTLTRRYEHDSISGTNRTVYILDFDNGKIVSEDYGIDYPGASGGYPGT